MNMNKNTKTTTTFGRIAKTAAVGAALLGSTLAFAGTAGAASGEAELGSALSASMSVSSSGVQMIQITEVMADGTVKTLTVPADSIFRISGIDQARQSINLAAM